MSRRKTIFLIAYHCKINGYLALTRLARLIILGWYYAPEILSEFHSRVQYRKCIGFVVLIHVFVVSILLLVVSIRG